MPSEQRHLAQAHHNVQLARLLAQDMVYKDWIVTILFYAALHYVEALFAKRYALHGETHPNPHLWRLDELRRRRFSLACLKAYRKLYIASRNVRYLMLPESAGGTAADFYSEREVRAFLNRDLEIIKHELGY